MAVMPALAWEPRDPRTPYHAYGGHLAPFIRLGAGLGLKLDHINIRNHDRETDGGGSSKIPCHGPRVRPCTCHFLTCTAVPLSRWRGLPTGMGARARMDAPVPLQRAGPRTR